MGTGYKMVKRELSAGFRLPMKTFFQALKSCSYIKFKINGYVPHSCLATCSFTDEENVM